MVEFAVESLLGKSLKDPLFVDFFKAYDGAFEMSPGESSMNIDVYKYGFSCILDLALNRVVQISYYSDIYFKENSFAGGVAAGEFSGALPDGLAFRMSPDAVVRLLGEPRKAGGGGRSVLYGKVPRWFKYHHNSDILHVQFTSGGDRISILSLMLGAWEAGKWSADATGT